LIFNLLKEKLDVLNFMLLKGHPTKLRKNQFYSVTKLRPTDIQQTVRLITCDDYILRRVNFGKEVIPVNGQTVFMCHAFMLYQQCNGGLAD
jgi:hypothetical protein